jgi:hypothetical protein
MNPVDILRELIHSRGEWKANLDNWEDCVLTGINEELEEDDTIDIFI